jgi:hypothetical protein
MLKNPEHLKFLRVSSVHHWEPCLFSLMACLLVHCKLNFSSHKFLAVVWFELRSLPLLGRHSTTDPHPSPFNFSK